MGSMAVTQHILVVNGHSVRQPVFVLGAPHSGADLLARSLKRAPGFHLTIGRPNVLRVIYAFARRPSIQQGRDEAVARVLRDAFAEAWQVSSHACLSCAPQCRQAGGVNGAGPCVTTRNVTRYGDASPDLLHCAQALLSAFPDARLVQIVRDGRDVVADMLADESSLAWFRPSFANLDEEFPNPFFGIEDETDRSIWSRVSLAGKCALRWRGAIRQSARLRSDLSPDQLTTLRYEDLIRHPGTAAAAISAFLDSREMPGPELGLQTSGAPPVGGWRARLSGDQADEVEQLAGPELRRVGYA
jgi:Sulfotransferase family